eukprot:7647758-Lingulodinium_polyedra.AAC.1
MVVPAVIEMPEEPRSCTWAAAKLVQAAKQDLWKQQEDCEKQHSLLLQDIRQDAEELGAGYTE